MDWLAAEMQSYQIKPEIEAFDLLIFIRRPRCAVMAADRAFICPVCDGGEKRHACNKDVFDYYIATMNRLLPDNLWVAGIGRHQLQINEWCVAAGGHARTGLKTISG